MARQYLVRRHLKQRRLGAPPFVASNKKVGSRPLVHATCLEASKYNFKPPKTQEQPSSPRDRLSHRDPFAVSRVAGPLTSRRISTRARDSRKTLGDRSTVVYIVQRYVARALPRS